MVGVMFTGVNRSAEFPERSITTSGTNMQIDLAGNRYVKTSHVSCFLSIYTLV